MVHITAIHVHYSNKFWLRLLFYKLIKILCGTYTKRNICLLEKQTYEVNKAVSNTEYMKIQPIVVNAPEPQNKMMAAILYRNHKQYTYHIDQ
jgi:hypothetical protein